MRQEVTVLAQLSHPNIVSLLGKNVDTYTCTCMYIPDIIKLHTIPVVPLTIVYFMSEVHCTLNVLHSNTP